MDHLPQGNNLPNSPHTVEVSNTTVLGCRDRSTKENQPPAGEEGTETMADAHSSSEDENDPRREESIKKNKKKRVTRGDQLGDHLRVRLTEGAYGFFRARIASEHGFPDDALKSEFAREAFTDSYADFKRRGIDLKGTSLGVTLEEADLVSYHFGF